jgi:hypothetical protein
MVARSFRPHGDGKPASDRAPLRLSGREAATSRTWAGVLRSAWSPRDRADPSGEPSPHVEMAARPPSRPPAAANRGRPERREAGGGRRQGLGKVAAVGP